MEISKLSYEDKRSLLILILRDIRGSFDLSAGERSHTALRLAEELGYQQVAEHVRSYIDCDGYRDGRHFRIGFQHGGYEDPPFPVTRLRSKASPELSSAVDSVCAFPEYLLEDDEV